MNEITLKSSFDEKQLPKIKLNKKEITEQIYEIMDMYNTYKVKLNNEYVSNDSESVEYTENIDKAFVFTTYKDALEYVDLEIIVIPKKFEEKNLPIAKKQLAGIRKLSKGMNSKKIDLKKQYNVNLAIFENDIKDLIGIIGVIENGVDSQVKEYEKQRDIDRKVAIQELEEWKAIEKHVLFDENWLKKKFESKDDKTLKELFTSHLEQIKGWESTITMMANSHNLPDVESYVKLLEKQDYESVSRKIVSDADLLKKKSEENSIVDEHDEVIIPGIVIEKDATILTATRILIGTKVQLKTLKEFADKIGVRIEKVK